MPWLTNEKTTVMESNTKHHATPSLHPGPLHGFLSFYARLEKAGTCPELHARRGSKTVPSCSKGCALQVVMLIRNVLKEKQPKQNYILKESLNVIQTLGNCTRPRCTVSGCPRSDRRRHAAQPIKTAKKTKAIVYTSAKLSASRMHSCQEVLNNRAYQSPKMSSAPIAR